VFALALCVSAPLRRNRLFFFPPDFFLCSCAGRQEDEARRQEGGQEGQEDGQEVRAVAWQSRLVGYLLGVGAALTLRFFCFLFYFIYFINIFFFNFFARSPHRVKKFF
jgi:hypothetical protein